MNAKPTILSKKVDVWLNMKLLKRAIETIFFCDSQCVYLDQMCTRFVPD